MNIFQNSQKAIPKSDPQIIRVDMEEQQIGGRKSHLPTEGKSDAMGITHIPSSGSNKG